MEESETNKNKNTQPPTSEISITSIPQIILTEPPLQSSLSISPSHVINIQDNLSRNNLTPPSFKKASTSKASLPTLHSPDPLPLTSDLLKRKDKLDKLLLQKEKQRKLSQQQPQLSVDYFSNTLDERVTAGLGISTPANNTNTRAFLHSNITDSSKKSFSTRSEPEKSIDAPSLPSQYQTDWSYDLEAYRSNTSGPSIKRRQSYRIADDTSVSASSFRNSLSMRAYSAQHRYMDKHNEHDIHNSHFERPNQLLPRNNVKSKYYILDVLYNAAIRVVNSRAPESREIENTEVFEFNNSSNTVTSPLHLQNQNQIPTANIPSHPFENPTNEKIIDISSPHNIKSSLKSNTNNISNYTNNTPTTNSNPNMDSNNGTGHTPSLKNRFSWLSYSPSLENKSIFDNDSNYPSSTLEKIPTNIDDPATIPHPLKRNSQSLSDDVLPNPLQGNSLLLFSANNPIRILIWKFIRLRSVETCLFFLMILHWFLLACVPITINAQKSVFGGQWTHYPILGIQVIYTLEAVGKIIAYGLIIPPKKSSVSYNQSKTRFFYRLFKHKASNVTLNEEKGEIGIDEAYSASSIDDDINFKKNHNAYLNSFGNCFDMISVLCYWVDFVLLHYKYPYITLFKSLGSIRPIRLLSALPGTAVILRSLEAGWEQLLAVSGLFLFFLLLFALMGLISFQGVFSRRCYYPTDDNSWKLVEPALYCSGYKNGTSILGPVDVLTGKSSYPGYNGYLCVTGQICMESPANISDYGFVSYDTIFHAFLSVYTFVSLELWTDLMYQTQGGDSTIAALYYCLGVYIVAFVLSFLLFAVITSAFARVRTENEVSAFTAKRIVQPILRDAEGLSDEAMWTVDNPPEDLGRGVTTLKVRWWIVHMVKTRLFFYFGGLLVLLNMIFMCLRSFDSSEARLETLDNAETAFTFLFVIEIILRMIGASSWMGFWLSKTNLIDLFLVICTCVIQLPMIQDAWLYKYLTIFQILRIYRLFICIPRVRRLVSAAIGTGENVIYVMVFLILATALCSTVFMQMFGGDFTEILSLEDPETRFDTFWQSFVSLIVVYTSERWTGLLYNAMASQSGQGSIYAAIAVSLYFAFGRYVMSALYIAVVLENFELDDEYIRHYQIKDFIHRHRYKDKNRTEAILLKLFRPIYYHNENKNLQVAKLPANLTASLSKSDLNELLADVSEDRSPVELRTPYWIETKIIQFFVKFQKYIPFIKKKTSIKTVPTNFFLQDQDEIRDDFDMIVEEENREAQKESTPVVDSLFIFSNRSRFRYYCKKLVGSTEDGEAEKKSLFNWFTMACVFVSILMVILDEPSTRLIRKDTSRQNAYDNIEITLSIVFMIEVLIRIVADGLLLTPNAYLRNPWNQLDISVILLNMITIFMGSDEAPRGLSTFRSLRILRLIRYFDGVRNTFVALFYSFPLMFDASIFTFLVLIPFAIYGVNIFGGLMWLCNDSTVNTRGECIGEYLVDVSSDEGISVNILIPRVWQNPQNGFITFDNFQSSLQHLFSLTSTEGWVDSMFNAMSTPSAVDLQPHFSWESTTIYHGIFYIIFMIISQGTIQLFVGVIIEKFKEIKGITTLTTEQRQYSDLQRLLTTVKPTIKSFRPESRIRQICYDMVIEKHGKLSKIMMLIICLNIVAIASEFKNEPIWLENIQDYSYLAFTVAYVAECAIKFLGFGWKKWSRSLWNWFDLILASSALFLLILRFALPDLWTLRVERYCLVLAAFRLGEGIDALQTLYHTIAKSLPSIIQVSAVFMVAMCLFAMLFMEFFGLTKYGVYGTSFSNFRDYGNALSLLVRATTGEAWNALLFDYTVEYPNCNKSDYYLEDDCGSVFWSYFLFDIFYIICTHIFMNLFTAVIISNFEYAYETRTRFRKITKTDLRIFKHAWADIDVNGTGYIQKEDVTKLLRKLTGQFELKIYDDIHSVSNIIKAGKTKNDRIHSNSVYTSPKSAEEISKNSELLRTQDFNVQEINKCLNKMNVEEIRKRRLEFNICYKEILRAETPKGIPFASVLTILSYRFIDITTSLKLDPLIARLEMIEQLTQEYHLERAAGFFVSQIHKRRFSRKLWKKRDEDEVQKLGISNPSQFDFGSLINKRVPLGVSTNDFNSRNQQAISPVPRIIINNVAVNSESSSPASGGSNSFPVSPISISSSDNQYDPISSDGVDSLIVVPGTGTNPLSSSTELDSLGRSPISGGLSPLTPYPVTSPASRQNWLYMDGNNEMTRDISEVLMDSMHQTVWAEMLREETL